MKILMTADAVGGVWSYSLELADALAPHGVEIVLATMGPLPSAARRAEALRLPNVRLATSEFRLEWMDEPWEDVERAGDWLLSLEAREQPDLVQLNGYAHGALRWRAPTCIVAHSCSCSWWRAVRHEPAPPSWNRYREAVRAGLDAASLVIAPTRAMLAALEEEYGRVENAHVIHSTRRAKGFRPLAKDDFVLCVGRLWDEAKNVAALERVAPALAWPVYIAGENVMPGRADAQPAPAGRLGQLGPGELAQWMGRAAIYALPARYEPFGLSALEGALAGCALVLGDIASLRELWDGAALFVDSDDDDALRRSLERLIGDRALRGAVASNCRARALSFSPNHMAAEYLRAYETARAASRTMPGAVPCAS
jgi:glycogen synthase